MVNSFCEDTTCIKMFFKNIINTTVISVDHIGVVPWCIIWWFIWFFIGGVYRKLFQALLRRISINDDHSQQLIRLYWSIAFTSITVPFTLHNLKLNYSDVTDRFYYVLENHISRWFLTDPVPSVQTKLSYVILAGFYLNNICEVCFEFGLHSKEFILNELLGLFFIATFPLRCVQYGLAVTTVINVVNFFLSLSSLFSCFCDIAQTKSLRVIVYIFLCLHSILWFFAYFYVLPSYFMYASVTKMGQATDVRQIAMYILLNCSLFAHYIAVLITSPVSSMIFSYIRSSKINILKSNSNEEISHSLIEEKEEKLRKQQKKRENLLMLYHTVKCVIRIKRKLARIRKEKKTEIQTNCDETTCSHGDIKDSFMVEDCLSEHELDSVEENLLSLSTESGEGRRKHNLSDDFLHSDAELIRSNTEFDESEDLLDDDNLSNENFEMELSS